MTFATIIAVDAAIDVDNIATVTVAAVAFALVDVDVVHASAK